METEEIALLRDLLTVDSPAGDEYRMADWLTRWIAVSVPDVTLHRLKDSLIAVRGDATAVALFAHIDTNGYTVGYDEELIPIGSPQGESGDAVRLICSGVLNRLAGGGRKGWRLHDGGAFPGDRVVFAAAPEIDSESITGAYLDNRVGVYCALRVLQESERAVVAFTSGEEIGAGGAAMCARWLNERLDVTRALVSDVTWHTKHVRGGKGVAVSRRDALVPSQRYADLVAGLVDASGIPYQIEIESGGGSDGIGIERSGAPMDWLFVGAPQRRPHTCRERMELCDIAAMRLMLAHLCRELGTVSQK
jgi:putative aminopeptidase FrvX